MTSLVAVVDHRFECLDVERSVLEPLGVELRDGAGLDTRAALALCVDADAVLVGARFRFDAAAISELERCKVIVRYGVGFDNVDVAAASEAGIWIAYVPDYCVAEVADHAIALVLALNRRLFNLDAAIRADAWGIPADLDVHRLSECVLGVVGFGRIGEAVGRRAHALGMHVLAFDPVRPEAEIRAVGAEPTGIDELLATADYVTLHAPRLPGESILDAERISRIKRGACVINLARGGLVDEAALVRALESGDLGGAAVDVAVAEPLGPTDPLLSAPNLILTPHAAWYSREAVKELRTKAAAEAGRVLAGEPPLHSANELHVTSGGLRTSED